MRKSTNKTVLALIALVVVAGLLFAVWYFTRPATVQGSKALTIEVTHGDGTTKTFPIRTDAEYLSGALTENALVEGETTTYGLYITTCDGETANGANNEWWRISKDGTDLMVGADDQPIADGETYTFTLTVGFDE